MDEDRETVAIEVNDPPPEPEAVAEIADAIKADADAAVEIAKVEADAAVEIAKVEAEVAIDRSENLREDITAAIIARIEGIEEWREQHGPPDHPAIWEALRETQAMLLSLSERLTPPQTPEPSPASNPASEAVEESERVEPGPTPSEPTPASEPEKPASAARKVRWI